MYPYRDFDDFDICCPKCFLATITIGIILEFGFLICYL